jgi:hypothetical protein
MPEKLRPKGFGLALAAISALIMLGLGVLGNLGIYTGAVEQMQGWHIFFSLSVGGIIAGMVEAALWGLILGSVFAWLYNSLT